MEVATFTRGAFCENFNLVLFMDLICVKPATLLKHSSMDVFHAFKIVEIVANPAKIRKEKH